MGIVVVGLIVLVVYMAAKTPMVTAPPVSAGTLGTDTNVPALGVTGTISPAMTGGQPAMSRANHLRLDMGYQTVDGIGDAGLMTGIPPAGSDPGVFGGMTNANSDGGYKREDPKPVVGSTAAPQTNFGAFGRFGGFKF
jgi:hypothetical protein